MTVINVHITGPVYLGAEHTMEAKLSQLTDVVQSLVAEDSIVISTLDQLKAQADSGNVSAADVSAAVATLQGEHDKLVTAVAADTTVIPGSSTTGTGPASAPGSAPGDPTVPPAGTTPDVPPAPVADTPAGPVDPAPVDSPPVDVPAAPVDTPAADVPASSGTPVQ